VNAERAKVGLALLARLREVELAAQLHAMDMAGREYMDHATAPSAEPVSPDPAGFPNVRFTGGMSAADRLRACQSEVQHLEPSTPAGAARLGENVAYNFGYRDRSPQSAVTGWMNSSGHRANILNPSFQGAGIGAAVSASGKVYYCQMFVTSTAGQALITRNADLRTAVSRGRTGSSAILHGGKPTGSFQTFH
jgi:hypothetical protein